MRRLRLALLAGGVGVLVVLVNRIGGRVILAMLREVGWRFALVSLLYALHLAVRAAALWRSLPPGSLRYREVLAVRLSGEAVEMLTFTGPFLAEPAKGYLLKQRGIGGADAFGGVAVEYLLYTLVSSWMAAAALTILLARGVLPHAARQPIVGVVVAMGAFTAGCLWAAATGVGLLVPTLRAVGAARLAPRVEPVERVLVTFMHAHPRRLLEVVVIEIAAHALLVLEIWVVIAALGFEGGAVISFLMEGGVKFIGAAFFFVPGQIGASEGVYALLARAVGLPPAVGLTIALVRRVRALLVAVAGVGVLALVNQEASCDAPPSARSTSSRTSTPSSRR